MPKGMPKTDLYCNMWDDFANFNYRHFILWNC